MPNNFKLRGDYYVSKAGNDANDGLTPDTPLLTVQAALNKITSGTRTVVVGSGVYRERITKFSLATVYLVADGNCVLEGQAGIPTFDAYGPGSGTTYVYFTGFEIRNQFLMNIGFGAGTGVGYMYFTNCVIKNCTVSIALGGIFATYYQGYLYFTKCTFINCRVNRSNNASNSGLLTNTVPQVFLELCNLISTTFDSVDLYNNLLSGNSYTNIVGALDSLKNSYVDPNSSFSIRAVVYSDNPLGSASPAQYNTLVSSQNVNLYSFNNIRGKIICNWNGAVSGASSRGVALTLAQHRIDYPTFNANSISSDPLFNNPQLLDFTLQSGSPNVSASSDFVNNIGGTEYAVSYTASSAAFTTNATSQSLQYLGNLYYSISGSELSGSITSGPMFLQWPRTRPLTSVNFLGSLEFNKSITASLAGNNNVPAYTTFTSASLAQGANPDRLKIAIRYSTQQGQPSTDAEWDNNGYWPAGTYQLFEINTKPKVDYKGTGNGDPTYVETPAIGDLVPSWVQAQIILRNNYNF